MTMGTFVVDSSTIVDQSCKTVLGYKDVLRTAANDNSDDPDFPISSAFDYSYNTEFAPTGASSTVIIFSLSGVMPLDYFMLISKNAQSSGLSVVVDVFRAETGAYENVAGFGSMTDGVPVMVYFGDKYTAKFINALKIKITLTYTSKPYIMTMMCGKAIVFPRTFSLGFQPAHMAFLDEVSQFDADEGLNVIQGRRQARGKQLRGTINFVRITLLDSFWVDFTNYVLDSKPFCMMWNSNKPAEIIYGIQDPKRHTKPSYKNQSCSQIDFEVIGWA